MTYLWAVEACQRVTCFFFSFLHFKLNTLVAVASVCGFFFVLETCISVRLRYRLPLCVCIRQK